MKRYLRTAVLILIPAGLFLGAVLYYINLHHMTPAFQTVTRYAYLALFAALAVMSWKFNRSRVFFCILSMALCQALLALKLPTVIPPESFQHEAFVFMGIFIPANILVFSFFKERGIFTLWGALRIMLLILQCLLFLWWSGINGHSLSSVFSASRLWKVGSLLPGISQPSMIVSLLAMAVLMARGIICKSFFDMAFTVVIPMSAAAAGLQGENLAVPVFYAFAGLVMLIAIIQDSYFMAFRDELTGLPSRRALKHEMMKLSGHYTIAMVDVDFFKKFNDTYGHDVGDQVLRMVSAVMRDAGGGGKPFRYGGEEFTMLYPGKGVKEALPYLEELREAIAKRKFTLRSHKRPKKKPKKRGSGTAKGKQLSVTVSIGAAERCDKHRKPDEVIKAADTALYRAKKKGRNCVCK